MRFGFCALVIVLLTAPGLASSQEQAAQDEEAEATDAETPDERFVAEVLARAEELVKDKNYWSRSSDRYRVQTDDPDLDSKAVVALLEARPEVTAVALQEDGLRVELRPSADAAPLVSLLVGNGVEVEEVRRGKASLEEVFVTLVEEEQ